MIDETAEDLSSKLNVLIALSLRQLTGDKDFSSGRRKGVGEIAQYLAGMGLDAKDIAKIPGSPAANASRSVGEIAAHLRCRDYKRVSSVGTIVWIARSSKNS